MLLHGKIESPYIASWKKKNENPKRLQLKGRKEATVCGRYNEERSVPQYFTFYLPLRRGEKIRGPRLRLLHVHVSLAVREKKEVVAANGIGAPAEGGNAIWQVASQVLDSVWVDPAVVERLLDESGKVRVGAEVAAMLREKAAEEDGISPRKSSTCAKKEDHYQASWKCHR